MMVNVPISAFKRVQFGGAIGDGDLDIVGVSWAAATFKLDIRVLAGDTGGALVSLANASAGSQGVSATYNAAYVLPSGEVAAATIVRLQIDEATIEALALAARADDPVVLYYDLHVTPSGLPKRVFCFGSFTIFPGVTI